MHKQLQQLKEFSTAYNAFMNEQPAIPPAEIIALRLRLLREEVDELEEALRMGDLVGVADAQTDIQYILFGTVLATGMQDIFEKLFDEVHRSNMSKLGEDGKPILREDGKVLKGPNFTLPSLVPIINSI